MKAKRPTVESERIKQLRERPVAECEWCDQPASIRVSARTKSGPYRRFSCSRHDGKLHALVKLDLGERGARTSTTNPTGFHATSGRMLGPS